MKLAVALLLAVAVAVASGAAVDQEVAINRGDRIQKIVGGSVTTINQYPYGVALLHNQRGQLNWYPQWCGGSILTARTILTCAHCFITSGVWHQAAWWRARVGSTWASSGGTVLNIDRYIAHPSYVGHDFDLAILRTASAISYIANTVAPASIAGANYNLADNQVVWAIGWGATTQGGASSEQLRHVQVWTINQATCRARYGNSVTDNMLCSGWLDVGGRDQCQGDSGGPLIHNNIIVGVCSWGSGCAHWYYPGVNVRVSRFSAWIVTTSNTLQ